MHVELDPGAPPAPARLRGERVAGALPAHVERTLRAPVGPHPERRAVELTPRPDPRALRRLADAGVDRRACGLVAPDDEPRSGRASEALVAAFEAHCRLDLRLLAGRSEAMAHSLGYLLWFQRRFAHRGPEGLTADVVRACWGNHYICRSGPTPPELAWIHFALRGAAAFAALLVRVEWWAAAAAGPLLALPSDGDWFRDRLVAYWTAEGDAWRAWRAECDPLAL